LREVAGGGLTKRRSSRAVPCTAQSVIETDGLCIDVDRKTVEIDGAQVHLTTKEYQMLELLALRKGRTLTTEMFLSHLYGGMEEPEMKK
jgi:two-component system, cell cycle response regulator CtrA